MKKLIALLSILSLVFLTSCFKKEVVEVKTDLNNTGVVDTQTGDVIVDGTGEIDMESTGSTIEVNEEVNVEVNTSTGEETSTGDVQSEEEVMQEFEKELEELFKMVEDDGTTK